MTTTTPPPAVLQASAVTARYGTRTVLHGLDLEVHAGEIYALLGANGAGKTTTLSLFLGFLQPASGQVRVDGLDPVTQPAAARSRLAYIPENVALYEHLSARENLSYLLHLAGQPAEAGDIGRALAEGLLVDIFAVAARDGARRRRVDQHWCGVLHRCDPEDGATARAQPPAAPVRADSQRAGPATEPRHREGAAGRSAGLAEEDASRVRARGHLTRQRSTRMMRPSGWCVRM